MLTTLIKYSHFNNVKMLKTVVFALIFINFFHLPETSSQVAYGKAHWGGSGVVGGAGTKSGTSEEGGQEKEGGEGGIAWGGSGGGGSYKGDFSGGGKWNGGHKGSIGVGGSVGGSWSISGIISWIRSLLGRIISIPIAIPKNIIVAIRTVLRDILSLNFSAILHFPINTVKKVMGIAWASVKGAFTGFFKILVGIKNLNAEVISGITNRVTAAVGLVIKLLMGVNIFGIKTFYNIGMWMNARVNQITSTICSIIIWAASTLVDGARGMVRILHIKDIIRLPVVKQVVGTIKRIHDWKRDQIFKALTKFYNFVQSIIYEHKDFFMPIFNWILNLFNAIGNAWTTLRKGGNFSEILAIVGNLRQLLDNEIPAGWRMGDLCNKIVGFLRNAVKENGGLSVKLGHSGGSSGSEWSKGSGSSFGGSFSFGGGSDRKKRGIADPRKIFGPSDGPRGGIRSVSKLIGKPRFQFRQRYL